MEEIETRAGARRMRLQDARRKEQTLEERKAYGEASERNLKLLIAVSRGAIDMGRATMRTIKEHGLTSAQFMVLEVLYHKGPMKVREITEKILSSGGNMTVVIANLEREGYVERHTVEGDRRAFLIAITALGKEKMAEVFPDHLQCLEKYFARLTEEEKGELMHLLRKMQGRAP